VIAYIGRIHVKFRGTSRKSAEKKLRQMHACKNAGKFTTYTVSRKDNNYSMLHVAITLTHTIIFGRIVALQSHFLPSPSHFSSPVQRHNSHPGSPGAPGGPPRAGGPRPGQGKNFFVYFSFSYQKDKKIYKILNFTCG